jgi:hypothetical protein
MKILLIVIALYIVSVILFRVSAWIAYKLSSEKTTFKSFVGLDGYESDFIKFLWFCPVINIAASLSILIISILYIVTNISERLKLNDRYNNSKLKKYIDFFFIN